MHIKLDGPSNELHLSMRLNIQSPSHRDWLIGARLSSRGTALSPDLINWKYSTAADTNFVYVEMAAGTAALHPETLSALEPFDAVSFTVIPWSRTARAAAGIPEIMQVNFAVRGYEFQGENIETGAHLFGTKYSGKNN